MIYERINGSCVLRFHLQLCAIVPGTYGAVLKRRVLYTTRSGLHARHSEWQNTCINTDAQDFS